MDDALPISTSKSGTRKAEKQRTTITLSADAVEKLQWLARVQKIPPNEAIRRAIATESYVREQLENGSKILVQKSDKSMHELVFIR